jgi:hypothetical protein
VYKPRLPLRKNRFGGFQELRDCAAIAFGHVAAQFRFSSVRDPFSRKRRSAFRDRPPASTLHLKI